MTHTIIFVAIMALIVIGVFFLGLQIGLSKNLTARSMAQHLVGSIVVDMSGPDSEPLSLKLDCTLGEMISKKFVILEIEYKSSQEKPLV